MITVTRNSTAISSSQRQQLKEDGYFIADRLFDESTIAIVREEFERLNVAMDQNKAGGVFASELHKKSDICKDFLRHPVFADLCNQLIGPTVFQSWNQMIYKRPKISTTFAWHQDGYYATHNPDGSPGLNDPEKITEGAITFWVAITPTTISNGCLWVLPKRHQQGLLPHTYDASKNEWVGDYDTSKAIPAILEPGQIFVFTGLTPHCSGANQTDKPRMGYQIGYRHDAGLRDSVPFLKEGQIVNEQLA